MSPKNINTVPGKRKTKKKRRKTRIRQVIGNTFLLTHRWPEHCHLRTQRGTRTTRRTHEYWQMIHSETQEGIAAQGESQKKCCQIKHLRQPRQTDRRRY